MATCPICTKELKMEAQSTCPTCYEDFSLVKFLGMHLKNMSLKLRKVSEFSYYIETMGDKKIGTMSTGEKSVEFLIETENEFTKIVCELLRTLNLEVCVLLIGAGRQKNNCPVCKKSLVLKDGSAKCKSEDHLFMYSSLNYWMATILKGINGIEYMFDPNELRDLNIGRNGQKYNISIRTFGNEFALRIPMRLNAISPEISEAFRNLKIDNLKIVPVI